MPPPPSRRLDEHGEPDPPGCVGDGRVTLVGWRLAGNDGNPGQGRDLTGGNLRSEPCDHVGRRAHEGHAGGGTRRSKVVILSEKAVAGMDRFGARRTCRVEDRLNREITAGSGRRTDADCAIRERHVQRTGVGVRIHGHRLDAQLAARTDDADRDLAAIGNQQTTEHMSPFRSG